MNTSRIVEPRIDPKFYTSTPAPKLTPKAELFQLEHEIELHWTASAAKLQIIKDRELWRADGYASWKDYCERRWHKSRQSMYQLLEAGKVLDSPLGLPKGESEAILLENGERVSDYFDTPSKNPNEMPLSNPSQARALAKVPRGKRVSVIKKAVSGNGHLTAKAITEAAPKPRNNGKPVFMLPVWKELNDGFGRLLNRADEANRALPDKVEHAGLLACIKDGMARVERWHKKGRA